MKRNKWLSRRFLAALWAGALATYIIIANRIEFLQVCTLLISVVLAWVGGESWLKKVYWNKDKE